VPTKHYLNLNYICNEHCVFCASDLTNNIQDQRIRKQLTLPEIREWIAECPPHPDDEVLLAGGEPTLHRDLFEIVGEFASYCTNIKVFTNGVKLARVAYAGQAVMSGISGFEIALFGATGESHDAITRRPHSFDQTMEAINNLLRLRDRRDVRVVLRLLVAKHCYRELPDIVRVVHEQAPEVDEFSINRLIYSDNALASEAMVSWAEATPAVNEAVEVARGYGYPVNFWPVPLCVFKGKNQRFVEAQMRGLAPGQMVRSTLRYLDPVVASAGSHIGGASSAELAAPKVCRTCAYQAACGGVEREYVVRFGEDGLGF
jgi:MoaA/NifB/PqqE/SkfB family radical SAM enzyme